MTASWLEVRTAYEQAIKTYQELGGRYDIRRREIVDVRAEFVELVRGFQIQDSEVGPTVTGLTAMERRLESLGKLMVMTADLAKHYLRDVDPDNANGTTDGLQPPSPYGPFLGGNQEPDGPPVPPPRQRLEDNSRNRTYVYTELAFAGLQDLIKRGQALIVWRKKYLDASGHGRLRHGGRETITDQRLKERIERAFDPITGTEIDWENGREHSYLNSIVTAFVDDTDLVWAEMMAVSSKAGKRKRKSANDRGGFQYMTLMPAVDVFGPNFRDHIRGYARTPDGAAPVDFPDDTLIRTIYTRNSLNDEWGPKTCHPFIPNNRTGA